MTNHVTVENVTFENAISDGESLCMNEMAFASWLSRFSPNSTAGRVLLLIFDEVLRVDNSGDRACVSSGSFLQ